MPENTACTPSFDKFIELSAAVEGCAAVKIKLPQKLCLNATGESGAGLKLLQQPFWLTCTTKFEIQEIKSKCLRGDRSCRDRHASNGSRELRETFRLQVGIGIELVGRDDGDKI